MDRRVQIHESSHVDNDAIVGKGTKIWQFCTVLKGAVIGERCNIGQNVYIEGGVTLGNGVKVKNNVALYSGVECEDDVFLGPNCVFTNVLNPRSFIERKSEFRKTMIQKGATIGANATIVCGHIIGKYAFVGAGTVVTKDVPAYGLIAGNPGKMLGYVCKCGVKLLEENGKYFCPECRRGYLIKDGELEEFDLKGREFLRESL